MEKQKDPDYGKFSANLLSLLHCAEGTENKLDVFVKIEHP